ncbi:MAG: hypothetical protein ACO1NX_06750 [Chitinophagaceae bacterium]
MGPLLFGWLLFSIYRQVTAQPQLEQSWQHIRQSLSWYKVMALVAVIILMLANWGIEALKWKLSVSAIHPVSYWQSYKAILSGVSFSVTLPNRIGEYAGRLMFLPEGKRLKAIANTIAGSISQLLITLVSGLIGFAVLKQDLLQTDWFQAQWHPIVFYTILVITVVLTLLYFGMVHISRWIEHKAQTSRYIYLIQSLKTFNVQLLLFLLLLSLLRYVIFVAQYFLLFSLFEVHASAGVVWSVMSVVFLTLAVVPTIALVEIGLRGKISLVLMTLFTTNGLGVLLTSVSAWAINLIIPALAGSVLILSIKVFKRKNENIEV